MVYSGKETGNDRRKTKCRGSGKSGQLKIFFGYAAGVGKTYAMLQAALTAEERGMDVVIGSIAPYRSLEDTALAERLRAMERLEEFDLDRAIRRKPDLIIMDDLACENPKGSRHSRRYQDIRELLKAGISVYTTVSAQNIESLNDIVTALTSVRNNLKSKFFVNICREDRTL